MFKQIFSLFIFTIFLSHSFSSYSQEVKAEILQGPAEWRYEKIDFPLDFAPEITYEGYEELRFAPGMFDTLSSHYFSYVFAIAINKEVVLDQEEITDFLSKYYIGLSKAVAQSNNTTIDASKIKVAVNESEKHTFHADVNFLDTFTNGQEVLLHMELEVITTDRSYILALVSPQEKDSDVWKELYQIKDSVKIGG